MLDELGDALAGERRQPLLGARRADEARVELLVLPGAGQRVVEVHLHLEQLAEVLVQRVEEVVSSAHRIVPAGAPTPAGGSACPVARRRPPGPPIRAAR